MEIETIAHTRFSSRDDTFGVFPPESRFVFWLSYSDDGGGPAGLSMRLGLPEYPPSYAATVAYSEGQPESSNSTAMYYKPFAACPGSALPTIEFPAAHVAMSAPSFVCLIDTVPLFHQRLKALSLTELDRWGARVHVFRSSLVPNGPMPVPTWESFPAGAVIKIRIADVTDVIGLEKYWSLLARSFLSCCLSNEGLPFATHVAGVSAGFNHDLRLWLWTVPTAYADHGEIERRFVDYLKIVFGDEVKFSTSFSTIVSCLSYKARLNRRVPSGISIDNGSGAEFPLAMMKPPPLFEAMSAEQAAAPSSSRSPGTTAPPSPQAPDAIRSGERLSQSMSSMPVHMNPAQFQWRRVQSQYNSARLTTAGTSFSSSTSPFQGSPNSSSHAFQHHVHQHYHTRISSSGSTSSAGAALQLSADETSRVHANYLCPEDEEEYAEHDAEEQQTIAGPASHRTVASIDADLVEPCAEHHHQEAVLQSTMPAAKNSPVENRQLAESRGALNRTQGHRTVASIDTDPDVLHKKTRRGTRAGKGRKNKKKSLSSTADLTEEGGSCGTTKAKAEQRRPAATKAPPPAAEVLDDEDETGSVVEHEEVDEDQQAPEWKSDADDSAEDQSQSPPRERACGRGEVLEQIQESSGRKRSQTHSRNTSANA